MTKIFFYVIVVLIIAAFVTAVIILKKSPASEENNINEMISGFKMEVIKEGTGQEAKAGNTLSVHYVGTLENGQKFDSSRDRGAPFEFTLGAQQVIPGWDFGLMGMKVGEKRKLVIPPVLAYGDRQVGSIPPNSTLIFEVELLGIK